jgi:hypothetical protein
MKCALEKGREREKELVCLWDPIYDPMFPTLYFLFLSLSLSFSLCFPKSHAYLVKNNNSSNTYYGISMDTLLFYPMQSSEGAHIQIIPDTTINDGHRKGSRSGDGYCCLINNPRLGRYSVMRENGVNLEGKDFDERPFLTRRDFKVKLQSLDNAVIVYCDLPDKRNNGTWGKVKRSVYEIKDKCFRRVNVDEYRADLGTEAFFEDI